jgi:FlaA1/EpsC-like NDP-sugar epimerase
MVDHSENNLFEIDLELRERGHAALVPVIADCKDRLLMDRVIERERPQVVFHAAAYKHVPMMELNPIQAVANNALATVVMSEVSERHGVERFCLISTDKAVEPKTVMGASKALAERVIEQHRDSDTRFAAVRFGNVLGSNGSVFPLFQKQIAAGGPVTVTHPEVRRFFMTTNEAVQLVLQVSIMGKRSEIFVLDMGELMKVDDLARKMIELAGLEPDSDIRVEYVGLRPGEKLYEEVITRGERVQPTHHDKIKVFRGPSESADRMMEWMRRLELLLERRDEEGVVAHMSALVPEYRPSLQWEPACMREDGPAGQVVEIAQSAHAGAASN